VRPYARIDAAQTTDENKRHWANADFFSADAAYDQGTRFRLRNRARYEVVNNCYAKASVRASADDMIGTGPRLQLNIEGDTTGEKAKKVESLFSEWMDETKLALKLRVAQKSRVRDGECFAIFDINERLANPVKTDLRWIEADQCTTPFNLGNDPYVVDGIRFDNLGNPTQYYFLQWHPGSVTQTSAMPLAFETLNANQVLHWFIPDRFGQHRAIPEITPALPLYSQVRRYTLATLTAAEFAAMLAGVMKTKAAPETGAAVEVDQWTMFEMVRGALLTLPDGWEATQFQSTQPTATYAEFKRELLNESGRSTNQPLNVVTGNSSGYNFSSGRLDHLPYQRGIRIERHELKLRVLDPILRDAWYVEALLNHLLDDVPPIAAWKWSWNWDGFDSIDQNKDATADDTRIKNGTSTYSEILAEYGQDWCEVFEQLAKEKAYAEQLGLPWPILSNAPTGGGGATADQGTQPGQSKGNMEQTVQFAMEQAGIPESDISALMELLVPTFKEIRQPGPRPSRNGFHKHAAKS
jgi:lambda family phage portal protein